MEQLNNKVDGTGLPENSLPAPQWNQVPSELQNVITNSGQALSSGDLNQLGKGIAHYVANGSFYTDSGAADAYSVSTIGTNQSPPEYAVGMLVCFVAANNNTGGAATIDVAGLGVKSIKTRTGGDPTGGLISTQFVTQLIYNGTNFIIYTVTDATDTVPGVSEKATVAECNALTDTNRFVTPGRIPIASETQQGVAERATAAEANALSDTTRFIVPATIPIASETQQGVAERATQAEVDTGTDTTRYVSPSTLQNKLDASSITSFSNKGQVEHVFSGNTGTNLSVDTFIGAAWESVGPTGSGATNIWTDMDNIPSTATAIDIGGVSYTFGSTSGDLYTTLLHGRKTGTTVAANNTVQTPICGAYFRNRSGLSEEDRDYGSKIIALDANLRFDLFLSESGTGVVSTVDIWINSVIESL